MPFHLFRQKPKAKSSALSAYDNTRNAASRKYFCYIPFTQLYISFGGKIFAAAVTVSTFREIP